MLICKKCKKEITKQQLKDHYMGIGVPDYCFDCATELMDKGLID